MRASLTVAFNQKGYLRIQAELGDFSVLNHRLHVLNVNGFDAVDGLGRLSKCLSCGILPALL